MEYQKRIKANLIQLETIKQAQHQLKCVLATLQNVSIINPYATLINLPEDVAHPRKSLLLLLNFIEVITYFFQYQREQVTDTTTGEIFIKTHPNDIELAFKLLKNSLFRRADELSTSARGFYLWLTTFLADVQSTQFTALDIRKAKAIHPRTLNRYLQELKLYSYIQVTGGNKHRGGFIYKITQFGNQTDVQTRIEKALKNNLDLIKKEYEKQNNNEVNHESEELVQTVCIEHNQNEIEPNPKPTKRVRIAEKEGYTFKLLLKLEAEQPNRTYLPTDFTTLSGRSIISESRYLRQLWEQGKLNRKWENKRYHYTLAKKTSRTVSQTAVSNSQRQVQ